MNILTADSTKLVLRVLVIISTIAPTISATAAPGLIDFRNSIPGFLDAPVFRADGTNRLSGDAYLAQLYAGPDEYSLTPLLSLIIEDAPTPLIGLESFSLRAAPIRDTDVQGDQVVLRCKPVFALREVESDVRVAVAHYESWRPDGKIRLLVLFQETSSFC